MWKWLVDLICHHFKLTHTWLSQYADNFSWIGFYEQNIVCLCVQDKCDCVYVCVLLSIKVKNKNKSHLICCLTNLLWLCANILKLVVDSELTAEMVEINSSVKRFVHHAAVQGESKVRHGAAITFTPCHVLLCLSKKICRTTNKLYFTKNKLSILKKMQYVVEQLSCVL